MLNLSQAVSASSAPQALAGGAVCVPASGAVPSKSGRVRNIVGRIVRVDQERKKALQSEHDKRARFASKYTAAKLLNEVNPRHATRVSHCCYVNYDTSVRLYQNTATGKASIGGVVTCGSLWCCPCCSPRISATRKGELDQLMSWSRDQGYSVVMLTLTARHKRGENLQSWLAKFKLANQRLRQRRDWRLLPLVGSVTAQEVTYSPANGWHPHTHSVLVFDASPAAALEMLEGFRAAWLTALRGVGLDGDLRVAFDVQDASAAAAYIGKFGAAEEMALQGNKKGRGSSRSPWQILDDARDGCGQSARLWQEYAAVFIGKRQLVWSKGLKDLCGVGEVSDEQAADPDQEPEKVLLRVWPASHGFDDWRRARRRLVSILHAAETGGCLDAAERGPTDAEKWRRSGGDALIDCEAA